MSPSGQSLATLLKKTHISSPEDILKSANVAIKQNKTDVMALHVRIVALLKLERYEDVLRAYEDAGDKFKQHAPLEYAYALYRCDKLEEAQKIVEKSGSQDRGLLHVAAQSSYRLENFDLASQIYKQLASSETDEEFDLRINRSAVDAQLEWSGSGDRAVNKKPLREDLDAFESAYNAACGCIARGELSQADILLNRAKQLCAASQDLSEEEKKTELIPITIQQSYIASVLGRLEDAAKLYKDIDLKDISDLSLRHIGQVNSLAASPQPNPFLAHRIFHSTPDIPKKDAPFQFQQTILRQNSYAIDLQTSKFAGASKSTSDIVSGEHHPSSDASINTLSVISAAAKSHNEEGNQAIKAILPLLEKRPTDVGILLLLIQLYTLKKNHGSATALLEAFLKRLDESDNPSAKDVRHAPGLIAAAVALYNSQGRKSQSRAVLSAAASHWRSASKKTSVPPNTALLRAAGSSLLESGTKDDATAAIAIFTDLHTRNPNDKAAAAGLVAATCLTGPSSKLDTSLLKSLTPTNRLTAGIDAAALESAGVARVPESSTTTSKKRAAPTTPAAPAAKKHRKLPTSRIPKDYEEGKKVDTERWLPIRDRSSWRPKGKKGKAKAAGLTQGGVVDDNEKPKAESTKVVVGQASKGNKKKKPSGKGKW